MVEVVGGADDDGAVGQSLPRGSHQLRPHGAKLVHTKKADKGARGGAHQDHDHDD